MEPSLLKMDVECKDILLSKEFLCKGGIQTEVKQTTFSMVLNKNSCLINCDYDKRNKGYIDFTQITTTRQSNLVIANTKYASDTHTHTHIYIF